MAALLELFHRGPAKPSPRETALIVLCAETRVLKNFAERPNEPALTRHSVITRRIRCVCSTVGLQRCVSSGTAVFLWFYARLCARSLAVHRLTGSPGGPLADRILRCCSDAIFWSPPTLGPDGLAEVCFLYHLSVDVVVGTRAVGSGTTAPATCSWEVLCQKAATETRGLVGGSSPSCPLDVFVELLGHSPNSPFHKFIRDVFLCRSHQQQHNV